MLTVEEIIDFLENQIGCDRIQPDTDIFLDLGVVGDDFHELVDLYSKIYNVDMTKYLWYFHTDEEGQNFGGIIYRPPKERVRRIPITPNMLTMFANKGVWTIDYPKHTLPKRRYDLIINTILVICILVLMAMMEISKCRN
ncbi:MAG: DUF1493 family protein [Flavobacterium sp.]